MSNVQQLDLTTKNASKDIDQIEMRSLLMASAVSQDESLVQFIRQIDRRMNSAVKSQISDTLPLSKTLLSVFDLLDLHQRPHGRDGGEALLHVDSLVRLNYWSIQKSTLSKSQLLSRALVTQCFASLFFPNPCATWREILQECMSCTLENMMLLEFNRQTKGDLVSYLAETIEPHKTAQDLLRTDFNICTFTSSRHLIDLIQTAFITSGETKPKDALRWGLILDWMKVGQIATLPQNLNVSRFDWEQIYQLHRQIIDDFFKDSDSGYARFAVDVPQSENSTVPSERNYFLTPAERFVPHTRSNDAQPSPAIPNIESHLDEAEAYFQQLDLPETEYEPASDFMVDEIRLSNNPELVDLIDKAICRCRDERNSLSLLVIRVINSTRETPPCSADKQSPWHQQVFQEIKSKAFEADPIGYITREGELAILLNGFDRNEVNRLARETILKHEYAVASGDGSGEIASEMMGVICGSATVSNPVRAFAFEQLSEAAQRCLQGAQMQGRGAIKSLEVF